MPMERTEDDGLSMVVLAGGRSSRMGTDKSDLLYKDQTFLEIQIQKGKQLGIDDILISGYRGTDYDGYEGRIVPDRFTERGPLGGLEACLRQAVHDRCLVLSVDTPLVSVPALQGLIQRDRQGSDPATILRHGEKEEPLIGIYRTDLADAMAEALEKGRGSVYAFLKKVGYGVYQSTEEDPQFRNINERADYQDLLGISSDISTASRSKIRP